MGIIDEFISRRYGFDPDALGARTIQRVLQERMNQLSLSDEESYLARLRQSRDERHALLDALVVPETWFFRDPKAYELLQTVARDEWMLGDSGRVIRGLSAGCCTGEEPYSMVMALTDAGLPPRRFTIDAFDISTLLMMKAKNGVYGTRSFRAENLSYRNRYFRETTEGYRIDAHLRECINFRQANLLNPKSLPESNAYDFIFCRNVIIYLNREARVTVLRLLENSLRLGGLLFLGATETLQAASPALRLEKAPMTFAFRKITPENILPKRFGLPSTGVDSRPKQIVLGAQPNSTNQTHHPSQTPVAAINRNQTFKDAIEAARYSADRGRLDQAFAQCRQLLRDYGPKPEAYTLMGLMHQSRDHIDEAEHHYHKALYLDPDHYEALIHLSYLMLRKGDAAKAKSLRKRAENTLSRKREFAPETAKP